MTIRLAEEVDFGVIYDALKARVSEKEWLEECKGVEVTKQMFIDYCRNLPSRGIECDGKQIGGVFFDGTQMHIEVLPEYHGRWSLLIPEMGRWVFSIKDPIQVAVARDNTKINRFMTRNKWPAIKETDDQITYEMSAKTMPLFDKRQHTAQ